MPFFFHFCHQIPKNDPIEQKKGFRRESFNLKKHQSISQYLDLIQIA